MLSPNGVQMNWPRSWSASKRKDNSSVSIYHVDSFDVRKYIATFRILFASCEEDVGVSAEMEGSLDTIYLDGMCRIGNTWLSFKFSSITYKVLLLIFIYYLLFWKIKFYLRILICFFVKVPLPTYNIKFIKIFFIIINYVG